MTLHALSAFIVRRIAALIAVLLAMSFIIFLFLDLAPGSPVQLLLGPREATPATVAAVRHEFHLDQPFFIRYLEWLRQAVQFNFGRSIITGQPVGQEILNRLTFSLQLGGMAFAFALLLGVPLGLLAALRKRTSVDRAMVGFSVVGISAPAFASGILLLYVFAIRFSWFPVYGEGSGFVGRIWHLALPAIALGLTGMGLLLRLTRAGAAAAIDQDYVAFARARGISRSRILWAYVLRNSLVPIITASGLILAYLITGAVLVEVTFALPGVGSLLIQSISSKDIPVVQGVAMLIAFTVVIVNLVIDLLYLVVDPRIGFEVART